MTDPSTADDAALVDALSKPEEKPPARTPIATVKGMTPLQRPPAPPDRSDD